MARVSLGDSVTLLASTTATATLAGADAAIVDFSTVGSMDAVGLVLDVTDADTDSGDTLDVYVQTRMGSFWVDVCAFTQVTGDGSDTQRHIGKVSRSLATTMFENATALTAGNVRNFIGNAWRVRYAITNTGANGSFTFSVIAVPM